jgi:glucose repression regulatory protein TUP1
VLSYAIYFITHANLLSLVISVAFSPRGQYFATGSGDMKAKLWSYKTIAPPTSNNASEGERKS